MLIKNTITKCVGPISDRNQYYTIARQFNKIEPICRRISGNLLTDPLQYPEITHCLMEHPANRVSDDVFQWSIFNKYQSFDSRGLCWYPASTPVSPQHHM